MLPHILNIVLKLQEVKFFLEALEKFQFQNRTVPVPELFPRNLEQRYLKHICEAFLYQSVYFHLNCVSEESWLPCADGSNRSDSR